MADAGLLVVLVPLLFVIGIFGFFVVLITLFLRAIGSTFRALFRRSSGATTSTKHDNRPPRVCRHVRCGYANPPVARFCARCGRELRHSPEGVMHG